MTKMRLLGLLEKYKNLSKLNTYDMSVDVCKAYIAIKIAHR